MKLARVPRSRLVVLSAVILFAALPRHADAQYIFRGLVGSAPRGCGSVDPATLAGVNAGKFTEHAEFTVGAITNGCGDHPGELWPTIGIGVGANGLNIRRHATYFLFAMNFDVDAYAIKRRVSGETEGEKYLYFRPGFMAGFAVTGWGTHVNDNGDEGRAHLLFLGMEAGSFSGNGPYAMFTVTIRRAWYIKRQ